MSALQKLWGRVTAEIREFSQPTKKGTQNPLSTNEYFASQLGIVVDLETSIRDSYKAARTAAEIFIANPPLHNHQNLQNLIAATTIQENDAGVRRILIDAAASAMRDSACAVFIQHIESLLRAAQNDRDLYVQATTLDLAIRAMMHDETLCTKDNIQSLFTIAADDEHIEKMLKTSAIVPETDHMVLRCKALDAIRDLSDIFPPIRTQENFDALLKLSLKDVVFHIVRLEWISSRGRDTAEATKNARHIQTLAHLTAWNFYAMEPSLRTAENLAQLDNCSVEWEKANQAHAEMRRTIRESQPPVSDAFKRQMATTTKFDY